MRVPIRLHIVIVRTGTNTFRDSNFVYTFLLKLSLSFLVPLLPRLGFPHQSWLLYSARFRDYVPAIPLLASYNLVINAFMKMNTERTGKVGSFCNSLVSVSRVSASFLL